MTAFFKACEWQTALDQPRGAHSLHWSTSLLERASLVLKSSFHLETPPRARGAQGPCTLEFCPGNLATGATVLQASSLWIIESFVLEMTFRIMESSNGEDVWPDSSCSLLLLYSRALFGFVCNKEVQRGKSRWVRSDSKRCCTLSVFLWVLIISIIYQCRHLHKHNALLKGRAVHLSPLRHHCGQTQKIQGSLVASAQNDLIWTEKVLMGEDSQRTEHFSQWTLSVKKQRKGFFFILVAKLLHTKSPQWSVFVIVTAWGSEKIHFPLGRCWWQWVLHRDLCYLEQVN